MKKYFIYLSLVLFISACSSSTNNQEASNVFEPDSEFSVESGDYITPNTEDTEVIVSHASNDTRSVKVLSGSVTLVSSNGVITQEE